MEKIVSIFKNGNNQAIRLPKDMEFEEAKSVTIRREGRSLVLTPVKKSWISYLDEPDTEDDFLQHRQDIFEEGRVKF